MVTAARLNARLRGLEDVGVGPAVEVNRLAWTEEDAACRAWFAEQAAQVGLIARRDPAGNLWAYPDAPPPWWAVGSHLDSVRGGGRFDGPLGVVCGFEVAAAVARPVAVISFADEEGARFNTPTFGSRALAGRLADVLDREDDQGVPLRAALARAGIDPARLSDAPPWLARLRGFVEVHIDQGPELARAGAPVAVVSALVDRLRLQVELRGRADHAGTTPREERRDALAAAARLIVAAEELGEPFDRMVVTTARIIAEPNAPTTIAARVRLWIDARSPRAEDLDAWHERLRDRAHELAARTRVEIDLALASRSSGRRFDSQLIGRLAEAAENRTGRAPPSVLCFAGHDAGVLAERVPAAMLLVRNPTGVSHAPEERIGLDDAALAAQVLADALQRT